MSSDESEGAPKKRRVLRACDVCRRKKIRCNEGQGGRCLNCIASNSECTYAKGAKKRGPPKYYVELLEDRLEKMERLLQKVNPNVDLTEALGSKLDKSSWRNGEGDSASVSPRQDTLNSTAIASSSISTLISGPSISLDSDLEDYSSSDNEQSEGMSLAARLEELKLNPAAYRFTGKSSGGKIVMSAMAMRNRLAGAGPQTVDEIKKEFRVSRPEYWNAQPWEIRSNQSYADHRGDIFFPDPDLLPLLIDCYFREMNSLFPVLHRPTFERSVAEGLHLQEEGFAHVLLIVCSIGSRFVDDPRVLADSASSLSAGWAWFNQVPMVNDMLKPPQLYNIQINCLAVMFLHTSSTPHVCWSIIGVGIRMATDIGAHRRKTYTNGKKLVVQEELMKRAFWTLIIIDRNVCAGMGRPCALQDEDIDVEFPYVGDDDQWGTEPESEKMAQCKSSTQNTAFICLIKLSRVVAFALRTIYSINRSKVLLGFSGTRWEQNIVAELASAMNKWLDSIPDELRWDPKREDVVAFHQSANLYAGYYQLQIIVHRPFMPSDDRKGPDATSALAMCTNAARSCSRILSIHQGRHGGPLITHIQSALKSGVILLTTIWGGKRGGVALDPQKEMADVYRCMDYLRACEMRWHISGRFWDILWNLACASELPFEKYDVESSRKRAREESTSGDMSMNDGVQHLAQSIPMMQGPSNPLDMPEGSLYLRQQGFVWSSGDSTNGSSWRSSTSPSSIGQETLDLGFRGPEQPQYYIPKHDASIQSSAPSHATPANWDSQPGLTWWAAPSLNPSDAAPTQPTFSGADTGGYAHAIVSEDYLTDVSMNSMMWDPYIHNLRYNWDALIPGLDDSNVLSHSVDNNSSKSF